MNHPLEVVHLEHDGRVLLVNEDGEGPMLPINGRVVSSEIIRLPTMKEVERFGISWEEMGRTNQRYESGDVLVIKGYPKISWPSHWALKDDLISDNSLDKSANSDAFNSVEFTSKFSISFCLNTILSILFSKLKFYSKSLFIF